MRERERKRKREKEREKEKERERDYMVRACVFEAPFSVCCFNVCVNAWRTGLSGF